MKKRCLSLLLCLLMLVGTVSCAAEKHTLLYEETVGPITYCVRGSANRAKQIVLKAEDNVIWSQSIRVARSVGSMGGNYGFSVVDLNFDGYQDFMIACEVAGEMVSYLCWLWDPTEGYVQSKELSGLCNVMADGERQAVFSFRHTYETEEEYLDAPASSITGDAATMHRWEDGKLIPVMCVALTYYSESDMYCYSVSYYDKELGALGDSDDRWLTPTEYEKQDMSFLYYYK